MRSGGKAILIDYHRPHRWHPLKQRVFAWLEPFAVTMWSRQIEDLAGPSAASFRWSKRTRFIGLYQTVTAERV